MEGGVSLLRRLAFHRIARRQIAFSLSSVGFVLLLIGIGRPLQSSPLQDPKQSATVSNPDTIRQMQVGQLSRRAKALLRRQGKSEQGVAPVDTMGALAAIRAMVRDSSARLAHFHHVRRDPLTTFPFQKRTHPLYARLPASLRLTHQLDSSDMQYRIEWKVAGKDARLPIDLSFEEYRNYRMEETIRRNWEALAQVYELEEQKKEGLGEIFGQVTNIEIPVPKNPLFSIFGPNIIKLQINGAVDIHAAFRNTKSDLITASPLGQVRNEPDFNQEVQVNVKGEIGDKLTITADWNTQRTFEYENQLRVRYTGYEDEIIQSVEAGNVSLPTTSQFISSSQALFGIKTGMQFGPLQLTAVASQKKGQIKELTVSGGARATPFEKKAHEYSRDHFFLDLVYRRQFEEAYKTIPLTVNQDLVVQDIEVWLSSVGTPDPNDRDVVAFIEVDSVLRYQVDPQARQREFVVEQGRVVVGRFLKLEEGKDFTYDKYLGYISMNRSVQEQQAIAVAYTLPSGDIGNFGSKDTTAATKLVLKLVKPPQLGPHMRPAWDLMLKNIYPLGGRNIKKEGFELDIFYTTAGKEPEPSVAGFNLLEMFGLDRYKTDYQPGADGNFDYIPTFTINEARGEVIFPKLEPFGDGIRDFFLARETDPQRAIALADSFAFYVLYDTTFNGAANNFKNRFTIKGSITAAIASSYNLGFNVVEGSVEVIANGNRATPNVDFSVDYLTGQVTIRNPSLLVPGTDLQIRYEQNDLFQLASKSLLGARGQMNLGGKSAIGFTVMNLNQQTLSDKVRLGEEPISNTILGFDAASTFESEALTRSLNALPGITTSVPSSFSIRGEAAYMLPDPNTRKSTIPQDEGQGIAYLDDFEGARRVIPLGSTFAQWAAASVPFYSSTLDAFTPDVQKRVPTSGIGPGLILPDTTKMEYKAKLVWFNVLPSDVAVGDIWPNRSVATEQQQVTVLDLYFDPKIRAPFNYSMDLENRLFANPQRAWSGVMRPLGTTATNLLDENINFIELWIYFEKTQATAKLNIDLGIISEDVIPNRQLDTEDGIRSGIRNGTLNNEEDVGLDGLTDAEERIRFNQFIQKYPQFQGDPSGDNWGGVPFGSADPLDHLRFNGTENSAQAEANRFPDTEDLNRNNNLDRVNSYFEYELALDPNSPEFQRWVTGGNPASGWYQVRIPINEFTRQIGDPTFTIIESARLWITGAQDVVHVRMTEINLVGNQWEEEVKNDSTLRVSVVNIEDNPSYTRPPGVRRERDRTRPDQEIFGNEQSLNLIIHRLKDGDSRQVFKRYQSRPLDLFSYRVMKMFVHGDDRLATRFRYINTTDYDAEIFLRFGADTLNFYEYRAPIRPGWDPLNEIVIRFDEITAIKLVRDSATVIAEVPVPDGPPGAVYRVRGQPSLISIRFIAVGIHNPSGKGTDELNGEVWINELRLTDVDDTPGWAYGFETNLKLADIASISFNMREQDPFFHGLEQRFGSRNIDRTWSVSTSVGLEKFLPQSWTGSSLGFSYSHSEGMQRPRYLPGTDILVEEAAERTAALTEQKGAPSEDAQRAADQVREQSRTVSVSEAYAFPNIKLNLPSSSWLVTETINRLTLSFTYNTTNRRNPTTEFYREWGWNARLGYGLQFGNENYVNPLFFLSRSFKFYYLPRSLNVGTTLSRRQAREKVRAQPEPRPVVRNLNASRQMTFNWQWTEGGLLNVGTDYALDIQSNLVHLEVDQFGRQRSFGEILGHILGGEKLIDFGIDQNYGQSITFNSRPLVPSFFKMDKIIFPTARYSVRYDWTNNLQAGKLGKSAQWNSNFSLTMDVALKPIADEIWGSAVSAPRSPADTGKNVWKQLDQITRVLLKSPFFDFDRLSVSFTQSNRSQNSGVVGRPGFSNLFGRIPFAQESLPEYGPSLLYQLGLASDPHGDVVLKTKDRFPFFGGHTVPGIRAALGNLTDVFNQSNKITMRTSRPLWEGARLDLNWNVGWSYSLNRTITTDSLGIPSERSRVVGGDVERSFLSLPPTFIFKIFKTSVEEVNKRYERLKAERSDARTNDAKLAQAFEEGMEALPITKKIFGSLFPRLNWSIRWDGLEKFALFSSFAQRVSFDHSYTSTYRRRLKYPPGGAEVTESQQILYSFSPLVGLTITFKELFKGSFGATFRYGTSNSFDLVPANQKVTESATSDITLTANFNRRGFEIPFFGFSLSNDLDISFTYSYSKNARILYDLKENFKPEGTPQDGSTRTIMEPRIRYILSARVTASLYYKYTKVKPDEGGSRIPGSTINEGGLDIRVQIQ